MGSIREVLLHGIQELYLDIYKRADRTQRKLQARNRFITSFPKFVFEAIGMITIAILGVVLALQNGGGIKVLPF